MYTSTLTGAYLLFIRKDQIIAKPFLLKDLKVGRVSHDHSLDLSLREIKVWPLTHSRKQTLTHAGLLWPRYWLFCFLYFQCVFLLILYIRSTYLRNCFEISIYLNMKLQEQYEL